MWWSSTTRSGWACTASTLTSTAAALLARCLELGWVQRMEQSRAVQVTAAGRAGLAATFGLEV